MSLMQKQTMSEENRAAHQRNGRMSHGAATAEGKERSRAANLRHGFYSKARGEALAALGEDPGELDDLIDAAHEEWRPANPFQARITERMARLLWRMERAERIQQSLAARLMQQYHKRRRDKAAELREEFTPGIDLLESLETNAGDPRFYTPRGYFQIFREAFGEEVDGVEKDIFLLMHRLRQPSSSGARPGRARSAPKEQARPQSTADVAAEQSADPYLLELADWDDEDSAVPVLDIPVAEGAERDGLRQELVALAKMELKSLHAEIRMYEAPLSRITQDELQSGPHQHSELMQREEESCFRQFMRLGNFLMKMQNHAEKQDEKQVTGDRLQGTAGGEQVAADRLQGTGDEHQVLGANCQVSGGGCPVVAENAREIGPEPMQNEGASGDVDENAGGGRGRIQDSKFEIQDKGTAGFKIQDSRQGRSENPDSGFSIPERAAALDTW
jgi:hypothetical protein